MEKKRNIKELIAVCLLVLSLVLITVGTTFAFFQYSRQGTTENTLHTGTLTFIYDEKRAEKNGVNLTNAFPTSDDKGTKLDKTGEGVFDFDIKATTQGADINYEIYLTKEEGSTLPEYAVKTYLTRVTNTDGVESEEPVSDTLNSQGINLYNKLKMSQVPVLEGKEGRTLYQGTVVAGKENYSETYRFRMWIDEEADKVVNGSWKYNGKSFSVRVNVYAQNGELLEPGEPAIYKDASGANSPDLVEGLIPVYYRNGEWRKADLYKDWYDYDIQEWANAVTVKETGTKTRKEYQTAEAGTVIDMNDINTMWVWIPRYEYMFTDLGEDYAGGTQEQPGEIKVNFISGTSSKVSDENNYKIHPAFTFGDKKLTGIWYGKFETSNQEEKSCFSADRDCDQDIFTPEIKPGVTSWRNLKISTAFNVSRKMQTEKYAVYGFSNSENYDTHVSKAREWGSVAYLSQSKYGKYGNSNYDIDSKKVTKSNFHITGNGFNNADTYETEEGQKASTTGNITGVYDMNGGAWEQVMTVYADSEGKPRSGQDATNNSGFNGTLFDNTKYTEGEDFPDAKYYDLYIGGADTACNGEICYGYAYSETRGWYRSMVGVPYYLHSWVNYGGSIDMATLTGVFAIGGSGGYGQVNVSFRLVLTP